MSKQMFTKTNTWITSGSRRSAGKKRFPNARTCFTIFRRSFFEFMAAKQWTRRVVNCRAAVIVLIWRVSFVGEARIISPSLVAGIAVGLSTLYCCWVMLDIVPQSFRIIYPVTFHTAIKQRRRMHSSFRTVTCRLTAKKIIAYVFYTRVSISKHYIAFRRPNRTFFPRLVSHIILIII